LCCLKAKGPEAYLYHAAVKISSGEFDHPVKTSRKDELGKLVLLFDDMRKQLQSMNNTLKEIHFDPTITSIFKQIVESNLNGNITRRNTSGN